MLKRDYFKILILLYIILLVVSACSDDDAHTDQEGVNQIIGEWKAVEVSKDGDADDRFDDFKLSISADAMTTSGDPDSIFPVGNYEVKDTEKSFYIKCDQVDMTVQPDGDKLYVSFVKSATASGGKVNAVDGEYYFTLEKETN
ncbi:hypothetical protein [Fulvivirga ligni]|uniref:hypothetical protein n=1 Tax=Fulvivirga ligni TaxID=2904246 RepID=UPI001F3726F9|nr:hypothetical protein [Fulvivirga ligni]UII23176.1 hypothetical protein LVD16_08045 [Fulvivirga ligni]